VNKVLPRVAFTFVAGPGGGAEELVINFDYHLFTHVKPRSIMSREFPRLQRRGYPVSGPYCYRDALTGWTLNMDYDSSVGSDYGLDFRKECAEDLPCAPPAYDDCIGCKNLTVIEPNSKPKIVQVDFALHLCVALAIAALSLVVLGRKTWKLSKELQRFKMDPRFGLARGGNYQILEVEDENGDIAAAEGVPVGDDCRPRLSTDKAPRYSFRDSSV